jgi:hypothetical protein
LRLRPLDLPRPFEPCLLGSLGALVEPSRSTRLEADDERLFEFLDDDERLFELFDDEDFREPPERFLLLLDRELRWAIPPGSSWIAARFLLDRFLRSVIRGYPIQSFQTPVQNSTQRVVQRPPPARKARLARTPRGEQKRGK